MAAGTACAAVAAPLAGAHAIVRPGASRPADFQQYTVTVPTERDVPTVEVDLRIPEGVSFLLVQQTAGWKTQVIKRNDRIDEIRWTGSEIPPDYFAAFRFIARNPVETGDLVWKIVQRYKGGEVVRWIGGPDSETPASRTAISESAVPTDVLDVVSGRSSTPTAPTATTPATTTTTTEKATSSDDGRDGLTLGLAIFAALAAALAAAVALVAWRNGRRPAPEAA